MVKAVYQPGITSSVKGKKMDGSTYDFMKLTSFDNCSLAIGFPMTLFLTFLRLEMSTVIVQSKPIV